MALADTSVSRDMGSADTSTSTEDATRPVDMNVPDTASPDDMAAADLGADAATEDMSVDMEVSDAAMGACAAGYTAHEEVAGAVVACEGAADSLNQCDAAAACGAGWHMCTAAEYRAHFEAVEPAAVADATYWLSSCVRDGADPTAPSDVPCVDCTGTQTGGDADVSFSCINSISIETDELYVGVRAGSACTFVGIDAAGNDAFWNAQPSSTLQAGAFCCID